MDIITFPLRWPAGQKRRASRRRIRARFEVSRGAARDHLINELSLLGARYVNISMNVDLPVLDPAVAAYFDYDGDQMVFACDKWDRVKDNIRAIGKTIEAIRGIARWGSTDMMRRAVQAFKALPADGANWRATLTPSPDFNWAMLPRGEQLDTAKKQYRKLAAESHPDIGGSPHEMQRLNKAMAAAKDELQSLA